MAARSSIRKVTGVRIHGGASSERKMADPMLMGTAIRRARNDEYRVPKMNGRMWNVFWVSSQSEPVTNDHPNVCMDWPLDLSSEYASATMMAKMLSDARKMTAM